MELVCEIRKDSKGISVEDNMDLFYSKNGHTKHNSLIVRR